MPETKARRKFDKYYGPSVKEHRENKKMFLNIIEKILRFIIKILLPTHHLKRKYVNPIKGVISEIKIIQKDMEEISPIPPTCSGAATKQKNPLFKQMGDTQKTDEQ